jgi:hypothetical protein
MLDRVRTRETVIQRETGLRRSAEMRPAGTAQPEPGR